MKGSTVADPGVPEEGLKTARWEWQPIILVNISSKLHENLRETARGVPPQHNLSKYNLSRGGGGTPARLSPEGTLSWSTPHQDWGTTYQDWDVSPPGTGVPPGRDLGPVTGVNPPARKHIGPVEVL